MSVAANCGYNLSMLEIDGSYGEGGGQILRTALSLSCLLKKPFKIFNIRSGRKRPGLMPQHLGCVQALTLISGAKVRGDGIGSTELVFEPGDAKPGEYLFDIGTAGSTTLLLQAVLPPLIFQKERSRIILTGGTHVPFSPAYHFVSDVFIPMLSNIGITLQASILQYGFYPKGGGRISIEIYPSEKIKALTLAEKAETKKVSGISVVSDLPLSIADRQKNAALEVIGRSGLTAEIETFKVTSYSPGTFLFLKAWTKDCLAGFSSLGERGKKAETVGEEAAEEFLHYYRTATSLDRHLADQIVLYLARAGNESSFTTSSVTEHLLTNLWIIEKFLGTRYSIQGEKGSQGKVIIMP